MADDQYKTQREVAVAMADGMIGQEIDAKYKVLEVLGHGGMGIVYRTAELGTDRQVALKLIQPKHDWKPEYKQQFVQEIKHAAQLRGEHAVRVYTHGEIEDRLYYVMELVPGETLEKILSQHQTLPISRVVDIASQVCDVLAEAHQLPDPLVHRDLKPGNVFIEIAQGKETVKVGDFGLSVSPTEWAKEVEQGRSSSGTLVYMAPEQCRGEKGDRRTDLYALGVMLYEMLTGAPPFTGTNQEVIDGHLSGQPSLLPEAIPPALRGLVAQLLEKDPYKRPNDALSVRKRLEAIPREPISDQSKSLWRRSLLALAMAGIATLVLFGVGRQWDDGRLLFNQRPEGNEPIDKLQADPKSFSIVVAQLVNDENQEREILLVEALRDFASQENIGIEVLQLSRVIAPEALQPGEREKAGHAEARASLEKIQADALVWGFVQQLDSKKSLRLYWTMAEDQRRSNNAYHTQGFELPRLFWNDLVKVLRLVSYSQFVKAVEQQNYFIADRLEPFIDNVSALIGKRADVPSEDADVDPQLKFHLANAHAILGEQMGKNTALERAIALYRQVLETWTREHKPLLWAATQTSLGAALAQLGAREVGTKRIQEAVAAHQAALLEYTQNRDPLEWAGAQLGLGCALLALGERKAESTYLKDAVVAFQAALQEWDLERMPHQWSMAQNDLGVALWRMGERESGTERLEKAVETYRAVLNNVSYEQEPLVWVIAQLNLGLVLWTWGERETGTARLEESAAVLRRALQGVERKQLPLKWASIQNNLGGALFYLGLRGTGTEKFKDAEIAYRLALEENTRERTPLRWATGQLNVGEVLTEIGRREETEEQLEAGHRALRAALEVSTRDQVPLKWANTQSVLCSTLTYLGERKEEKRLLEEAVTACRAALKEDTQRRVPLKWAVSQNRLGNALLTLGEREEGTAHVNEAIVAFKFAFEERLRKKIPLDWATTQSDLGQAVRLLGERTQDASRVCNALEHHMNAWEVFTGSAPFFAAQAAERTENDIASLRDQFSSAEVSACLRKHEDVLARQQRARGVEGGGRVSGSSR